MKKMICLPVLLMITGNLLAQTTTAYTQLLSRFEQWKAAQYKSGKYATPGNCKMEVVVKDGYKGPVAGIPNDITVHYTDLNGDGKPDALITFNPVQCDGGNAMMNVQSRVFLVSKGVTWTADDQFIENLESKKDGWLSVSGVMDGTIFGTYYEYAPDDGRCCPGIKKPFTIDYKSKKLSIDNE